MSGLLPPPSEWPADGTSPVRILCGATATLTKPHSATDVQVWHHAAVGVLPLPMLPTEVCALVDFLWEAHTRGDTLVTWGGLASDWRVLTGEAGLVSAAHAHKCRVMARAHVDIAFAAATSMGGMMGLRAACAGMGLDAKHPHASALVPFMWAMGFWPAVLQHVSHDATMTACVYASMFAAASDSGSAEDGQASAAGVGTEHAGHAHAGAGGAAGHYTEHRTAGHHTGKPRLTWQTARGTPATWYAPCVRVGEGEGGGARLLTVHECLARPKPMPKFTVPADMDRDVLAAWLVR